MHRQRRRELWAAILGVLLLAGAGGSLVRAEGEAPAAQAAAPAATSAPAGAAAAAPDQPAVGANGEVIPPGDAPPGTGGSGGGDGSATPPWLDVGVSQPQPVVDPDAPAEGSGADGTPRPAAFSAPTIQGGSGAQTTASGVAKAPAPETIQPGAASYWPVVLGVVAFSLILYFSFWRPLMARLRRIDAALEVAVRPLGDGGVHGIRRLSPHRARVLVGGPSAEPTPLPGEGLSFAVTAPDQLPEVVNRLAGAALASGTGPVLVLSGRGLEAVAMGALAVAAPGDPQAAAQLGPRLTVAISTGRTANGLARLVQRLTAGSGVVILEHPRWLADLDGPSRAAWVLARLDERLADLSAASGVAVWVACAEGPLAPAPRASGSEHVAAVVTMHPEGPGGLTRRGHIGQDEIEDTWGGRGT